MSILNKGNHGHDCQNLIAACKCRTCRHDNAGDPHAWPCCFTHDKKCPGECSDYLPDEVAESEARE